MVTLIQKAMSGKADLPSGMTGNGSAVFLKPYDGLFCGTEETILDWIKSKPTVGTIGKEATPKEIAALTALANSGGFEIVVEDWASEQSETFH